MKNLKSEETPRTRYNAKARKGGFSSRSTVAIAEGEVIDWRGLSIVSTVAFDAMKLKLGSKDRD